MKFITNNIKRLFKGEHNSKLGLVVVGLFGVYTVMVATTIIGINERKSILVETRTVKELVTNQETNYLALTNVITMETALARGFTEAQVPLFVYVSTPQEPVALR